MIAEASLGGIKCNEFSLVAIEVVAGLIARLVGGLKEKASVTVVNPGMTKLTRTPAPAISVTAVKVKLESPARSELLCPMPGIPRE